MKKKDNKRSVRVIIWLYIIAPIIVAVLAPIYFPVSWMKVAIDKLLVTLNRLKFKFINPRQEST